MYSWFCRGCKGEKAFDAHEIKLLQTIVSDGRRWIIFTCPDCKDTTALTPNNPRFRGMEQSAGKTHIATPQMG